MQRTISLSATAGGLFGSYHGEREMIRRLTLRAMLIGAPVAAATCESLTSLKLADTTIAAALKVAAGACIPPGCAAEWSGISGLQGAPRVLPRAGRDPGIERFAHRV
jgi:hypothetical protein